MENLRKNKLSISPKKIPGTKIGISKEFIPKNFFDKNCHFDCFKIVVGTVEWEQRVGLKQF
jgi:hypothetical protein